VEANARRAGTSSQKPVLERSSGFIQQRREIIDDKQRIGKILVVEINAGGDHHRNAGHRSGDKAVVGVFYGDAVGCGNSQSSQYLEIDFGRGFFPLNLIAGNYSIEAVGPILPGCRGQ